MAQHHDPSLLQFVLDRLAEDESAVLLNTPALAQDGVDRKFELRLLSRRELRDRARRDREIVMACVDAMREVEGSPPVPPGPNSHPAVRLGSEVVKLIARTYSDHPDFDAAWG